MHAHRLRTMLRRNLAVTAALCLLSLFVLYGFVASRAQSGAKEEREFVDKIPAHLPIRVKVKNEEKVKDLKNENWLGDLEIEVRNVGEKPIYFLRLMLIFGDVRRDSGDRIGYSLAYGRGELIVIENRAEPQDVPIEPGGTHVFKLHESYVKGWKWYRTQVEQKPQPKKVEIIFSVLNFGDGTGFVASDGTPIPEKKSSLRDDKKSGQATGVSAAGSGRPPDLRFRQASFLLPAGYSPVNFFAAGSANLSGDFLPPQSCCTGMGCERMRLEPGGNCFCPIEDPEPASHVVLDSFQCQGTGFSCKTPIYSFTDCGEGITYHTCTQVSLVPCGDETPIPLPSPTSTPTPTPPPCPDPKPAECCECGPPPPGTVGFPGTWQCAGSCPEWTAVGGGCYTTKELECPSSLYTYSFIYGGICCPATPTPTPTPLLTGGGGGGGDICSPGGGFTVVLDGVEIESGTCISPLLVDVDGNGIHLTDVERGVNGFDLNADGKPDRIAWTAPGSDDAWLALDRNGDGLINNGAELFGTYSPQPPPPPGVERNGFRALAEYDTPGKGGNADGVIDARDSIFASLRLWQDSNHDGVSQPVELHTLASLGLVRLHLDYRESKRADEFGNQFRYRAKVDDGRGAKMGRWAWDVFLLSAQP